MAGNFIAGVRLKALPTEGSYLRQLPVVRDLWDRGGLDFRRRVTFLVGENLLMKLLRRATRPALTT